MTMRLTLATRRSALALAQSRAFARALAEHHPGLTIDELELSTAGDRIADRPLTEVGGKGLFVKELEEALLDGRAHIAVHSYKDVPALLSPHLVIACVPMREDARDALISKGGKTLAELPEGARVGTSSLRRALSLRSTRPDLSILPLRGNVDTRLRKMEEGQVDAVVLAMAGLRRLGIADRVTEALAPEVSLPAVGQGALAIECRAGDLDTRALLMPLNDDETAIGVAAERGVMIAAEGDCRTPIAAYAVREDDVLWLRAMLADPDGSRVRMSERRIPWPAGAVEAEQLGRDLGAELVKA